MLKYGPKSWKATIYVLDNTIATESSSRIEANGRHGRHREGRSTHRIVVVPTKNGQVRICGEFIQLNRAVLRVNHPMPTTEQINRRQDSFQVGRQI